MRLQVRPLLFAACIGCKAQSIDAAPPAPSAVPSAIRPTSPAPPAFDVAAIDAYIAGQVTARWAWPAVAAVLLPALALLIAALA